MNLLARIHYILNRDKKSTYRYSFLPLISVIANLPLLLLFSTYQVPLHTYCKQVINNYAEKTNNTYLSHNEFETTSWMLYYITLYVYFML